MKNLTFFLLFFCSATLFGQFNAPLPIAQGLFTPNQIISADLDNDGDKDIVMPNNGNSRVVWFENHEDGTFTEKNIVINAKGASDIDVSDIDGDGLLDIVLVATMDQKVTWYQNLGSGEFGEEILISSSTPQLLTVLAIDYDEDGDMDIVVGTFVKTVWFENTGSAIFSDEIEITLGRDYFLASSDKNSDGKTDLFICNKLDDEIGWLKNIGSGAYEDYATISTVDNPIQMLIGDLDSDSDEDFLVVGNGLFWYRNNGGDTFGAKVTLSDDMAFYSAFIGDMDGDGDLDILAAADKLYWFENLGGGSFGSIQTIYTYSSTSICNSVLIDSDGDGDLDAISAHSSSKEINLFENLGSGSFGPPVLFNQPLKNPTAIANSDLDNDGDLDVIVLSYDDNKIVWFDNYGDATFSSEKIVTTGVINPTLILIFDVDSDGFNDIIAGSEEEDEIYWFRNLGIGTFGVKTMITSDLSSLKAISFGDMDEDDDLDLLSTSFGESFDEGKVAWYENTGSDFGDQIIISDGLLSPTEVEVADIDGDGDLDVLVLAVDDVDYLTHLLKIENSGGAVFTSPIYIDTDGGSHSIIVPVDFDFDGDIDLFLAPWSPYVPSRTGYFENTGAGDFEDFLIIEADDMEGHTSIHIIDIDNDSDLDLLTYYTSGEISWIENTDSVLSEYHTIEPNPRLNAGLSVGDLDNDGDIDFLTVSKRKASAEWYENLSVSPYQVRGELYIDANENGIREPLESGLSMEAINCDPSYSLAFSYDDGKYFMNFDRDIESAYTITATDFDNWYITTDSSEYNIYIDDSYVTLVNRDFGFYYDTLVDEIEAELTLGAQSCIGLTQTWIDVKNVGTTYPSGTIHLEIDELSTFYSAEVVPDSIVGQNVYWHYDSLPHFTNYTFQVHLDQPSPSDIGELMTTLLTVTIDSLDEVVFTTSDIDSTIVTCSFDPNEKSAIPTGIDSLGYMSASVSALDYKILFQNTGTDTAHNVVIKDQIDPNLDWTSISNVYSSHEITIDIDIDGEISFVFDNIMLPDSNINEVESHGFVKFTIDLNEGLSDGISIYNTAHIYFDANPAIITNTKINTIFDCNFSNVVLNPLVCFNDSIHAEIENTLPSGTEIEWSLDGGEIVTDPIFTNSTDGTGLYELSLSIETYFCSNDTVYIIEVIDEIPTTILTPTYICIGDSSLVFEEYQSLEGIYTNTLDSETGCDSTVSIELFIYEEIPTTILDPTSICIGDSILIFDIYQFIEGIYTTTLDSETGCDSTLSIELFIYEEISTTILDPTSICVGDSILIFDEYQSLEGIYTTTLDSETGCDSTLSKELVVYELPLVEFTELEEDTLCVGWGSILLSASPSGGVFSGTGISGSEFDPSAAGEGEHTILYSYEDDNSCSSTASIQITIVSCLGVKDWSNEKGIVIYPNPFDDFTTIYFGETSTEKSTVLIFDVLGQEVYRNENVADSKITISKAELNVGMYIISILDKDSKEIFTTKLIVE